MDKEQLLALAEELGVADNGILDGRVQDEKSREAKDINYDGLAAQIDYLLEVAGADAVEFELRGAEQ